MKSRLAAVLLTLPLLLSACTAAATPEVVPTALPSAAPAPADGDEPPMPAGQQGGWKMVFSDEFEGDKLDLGRWRDQSSAEPDEGRGNLGNQQLEWNQAANCTVSGGELMMTAKREKVVSGSGTTYDWTSCLITSTPSYRAQYGYIEERSILPAAKGFWPAFWTWQTRVNDKHTETDVYEFYSDNHRRLYATQYSGAQGRCDWQPSFNPTTGWHTYGAAILPTGTTWYVDGTQVCQTPATSDGMTAIISNLAVYSKIPPDAGTTTAVKRVDYIRAWEAS